MVTPRRRSHSGGYGNVRNNMEERSGMAADRKEDGSDTGPARSSNNSSSQGKSKRARSAPAEWGRRIVQCSWRGAWHALWPLRSFLGFCSRNVVTPLYDLKAERPEDHLREKLIDAQTKEWRAYTRLLRIALLLLGGIVGFSYAASSGQLPLLLPALQRLQRPNDGVPLQEAFRPQPSYTHATSFQTRRESDTAGVVTEDENSSSSGPGDGEGGDGGYIRAERVQQQAASPQARGLQAQAAQRNVLQVEGLPPELPDDEQPPGEPGGREKQQLLATPQYSRKSCRRSERGEALDQSDTSSTEYWTTSSPSCTGEGTCGAVGGSSSEGEEENSTCSAATCMWLLLLLFSFIPDMAAWPRQTGGLKKTFGRPGEEAAETVSQGRNDALRGPPPNSCTTEAARQKSSGHDAQPQNAPLDNTLFSSQKGVSRREKQPEEQHGRRGHVLGWARGFQNTLLVRTVVERTETVEVFMQCVAATVVGFFFSFFLAKALFGCDSLLRQMHAHYAVLVLASHLHGYLFYFIVHPDKMSVDRFCFNWAAVYRLLIALSLIEMQLKPYELAAGATLVDVVQRGKLLQHSKQVQKLSGTVSALMRTHRREISKQKHLLHSIPVNMLMLELSWMVRQLRAAMRIFYDDGTQPTYSRSSRGSVKNRERTSSCRDQTGNGQQGDLSAVAGVQRVATARGARDLCSDTHAGGSALATSEPRTGHSDASCCCSLRAACDHWHRVFLRETRDERGECCRPSGTEKGSRPTRGCSCFSAFVNSDSTESGEVSTWVKVTGGRLPDNTREAAGPGIGWRSDTGEQSAVGSCWALCFLLSCGVLGGACALGGMVLQVLAQFAARRNFTYTVACAKWEDRSLVTHGVYAFSRHPAYAGWFYKITGRLMMVCNFVTLVPASLLILKYLRNRIVLEERMLERIFPEGAYAAYRAATPWIGIPFVARLVRRMQQKVEEPADALDEDRGGRPVKQLT